MVPRLYVVTDRTAVPGGDLPGVLATVADALPPGVLAVEVREKDLDGRALLALVRAILAVLGPRGVPVLVNDRLDVALAAGADGVHLPAAGLDPAAARRAGARRVARSTHGPAELAALDPADVDFATFGPIFDTPSKRRYGAPLGVDALRAAVAGARVPVLAIGGIDASTLPALAGTGVAGVAVIRAVLAARDPGAAARELLATL